MSGAFSRNKGARTERGLISDLRGELGEGAVSDRNLCQYQTGEQHDFTVLGLAVEARSRKRVTHGMVNLWWRECISKNIPVLAYKSDRQQWRFRVAMEFLDEYAPESAWIETDLQGFCHIAREAA